MAIGLGETMSAALRGENITVFLVNNAIYGMTGGQMAPTTHPGMKSTTSPYGRDVVETGQPTRVCEMLKEIDKATYVRRVNGIVEEMDEGIWSAKNVLEVAEAVKNAFKVQMLGGYAFLEILTSCSINWKMGILDAKRWGIVNQPKQFPPGLFRDDFGVEKDLEPITPMPPTSPASELKYIKLPPLLSTA